ncbi:MAG TPA: hypothetical protein PLV52_01800, partial [Candidatus Omnitrophota bacterium]|nr:hypothetical protein [Candidatus Omnitrophota bacterium]
MFKDRDLLTSIAISIAAHLALIGAASFIYLGSFTPPAPEPKKEFHVKISSDKPLKRLPIARAGSEGPVTSFPGYGGPISDTISTGDDDKTGSGLEREEHFTEFMVRGQTEESRALPDKRAPVYSTETVSKRKVRDDVISDDKNALLIESQTEMEAGQAEVELPKEFTTEMPGFTPVSSGGRGDAFSYKPLKGYGGRGALGGGGGGGSGIDDYFMADLVVYKDPDDGKKYFKITIMSGTEVEKFKVIPKDILFLVDCSLSIQSELAGFKEGMNRCLEKLSKNDTFNIIKFDSN